MFDALYIGATGMRGQQMQIDAIAQNVANMQSVGYRRNVVSFAEMVAVATADPLTAASRDAHRIVGAGALPQLTLSTTAGELQQTRESLHVAIDGEGLLEVFDTNGAPVYTRAGALAVNQDRMLATTDGLMLSARIQIPPDARNLRIGDDGLVTATIGDREEVVELGRIELARFTNPAALQPAGLGRYAATAESGAPEIGTPGERGFGVVRQGFLEGSNVQMTDELVNLMLAQRSFELSSRLVQAADQMLGITNSLYK